MRREGHPLRLLLACAALLGAGCATGKAASEPAGSPAPAATAPDAGMAPAASATSSAPAASSASSASAAPAAPKRLPGEEVLAQQPVLGPLKAFDAPVPARTTLPNGLTVYVVERPGDGLESVLFLVKRGTAMDPPKQAGLASLTAAMLEAGSAGKSQTQIAQAADALGADLQVGSSQDATQVSLTGLPTTLPRMTALVAQVALQPNFAADEWTRLKAQRKAELVADRAVPRAAATLAFNGSIYADHPLGRPARGTPESVEALALADVQAFFRTFSPKDAAVIAVGGARAAEVVQAVTASFGGWKAPRAAGPSQAALLARSKVPLERPRLVVVDYPGKPQSVLVVGQPAVPRSSPDYLALSVLNSVVGGSFTSRLNQNLREVHGYSYGAGSRFAFGAGPGPFLASSNVKTDVTGAALMELLGELDRAVAQPLTEDEVRKGKALLAYQLVEALEDATSAAHAMGNVFLYDLPLDEYRTFVPRLQALTAGEVMGAAKRVLQPGAMTVVIAGDVAKVLPQLKAQSALALPEPERRDTEGKPIAAGK